MRKMVVRKCCLIIPLVIGVILTAVGLILMLIVFPKIIEDQIVENVVLKEDTLQWYRFEKIPFPFHFSVNFWEVTNHEAVQSRAVKPKLKERGPYVWTDKKIKNIKKVKGDVVYYDDIWQFEYNEILSGGKKDNDSVVIMNALVLVTLQSLEEVPIPLPMDIPAVLTEVFGKNDQLFMEAKIADLAFNGFTVCNPEETKSLNSMLICLAIMVMKIKFIEYREDRSMTFSFFGYKTRPDGEFGMNTGTRDIDMMGSILTYQGKDYTNFWDDKKSTCNKVEGHYTTFPPFFEEDMDLKFYITDICRSYSVLYKGKSGFEGLEAYRFQADRFSFVTPQESCVCVNRTRNTDGKKYCFKNGLLDLGNCFGAPVLLSFPHLMWADKVHQDAVEGLRSAENESHVTMMDFEPRLGYPLQGALRIQLNVVIRPIKYNDKFIEMTKNLPRALLPVIWVEDKFKLTDELLDEMDAKLLSKLVLVEIVQWGVVGLGIVIGIITIASCIFCKSSSRYTV